MRKNSIPAICIWVLYTLVTCTGFLLTTMLVSRTLGYGPVPGIVVGIMTLGLLGLLVYVVHGVAQKRHFRNFQTRNRRPGSVVGESLLLTGILIGMAVLRLAFPWNVEQDPGFELAKVTSGGFVPATTHGGAGLYLYLLHGAFLLLGNRALAAVLLQILLQVGAALSLYLGIRRFSGVVSALVVAAFFGFAPFMLAETCRLLPLSFFLIFYGLTVWGIAAIPDRMNAPGKLSEKIAASLYYILVGLSVGFCCYLDVIGITLLIILTGVICCNEREYTDDVVDHMTSEEIVSPEAYLEALERENGIWGSGIFVFVCCLFAAILGYIVPHAVRSIGGGSVIASVYGQLELYMPGSFRIPTTVAAGDLGWDVPFMVMLVSLGAFAFWHSGKIKDKAIWLLAAMLLALMQSMGMTCEEYSDGFAVLYLFCAAMAGCSVADLFTVQNTLSEAGGFENTDMGITGLEITDMDAQRNGFADSNEQGDAAPTINYIENPLPLPKKHKPRVLDYDYEVADDDDFDI